MTPDGLGPHTALYARRRRRAELARDALALAQDLLGDLLVWCPGPGAPRRVGRIVETEAYRGPEDRACHASKGLTRRTATLLGPAGRAYVYRIYGMHDCFNVVCGGPGQRGHAVLVRAVEPLAGVAADARTDGPGRLCRALAIDRTLDACSLVTPRLFLVRGAPPVRVGTTARVGVGYAGDHADLPFRFLDLDSRHVSRPPRASIGRGPKDVDEGGRARTRYT